MSISYRLDGVATVTVSAVHASVGPLAAGSHTLTFVAKDNAGNASAPVTSTFSVTAANGGGDTGGGPIGPIGDSTAPVVKASAAPSGWANTDVVVTLSATDDSGATPIIKWAYGAASQSAYAGPITVTTEGSTTVSYTATDESNNSAVGAIQVWIDRTAPPMPQAPAYTSVTRDWVMLSWAAVADALSGTAAYDVYDGSIKVASAVTGTSKTLAAAPGSIHSYSLVAIDKAGNVSPKGEALDMTVPSGEGSANVGVGTNATMTVAVPGSGTTSSVTAVFSNVTSPGELIITNVGTPPAPIQSGADFKLAGAYFDVTFTGTFTGTIKVTFPYDPNLPEARARNLKLKHWKDNGWEDVPVTIDTVNHTITGTLTSLSPVALAEPATANRSTKITLAKKIVPSAYGMAAGIVAGLSDTSGTVLPGHILLLEKSSDGNSWSQAATMTAAPGKPGTYTGSIKAYRTSGRTWIRVRFAGDTSYDTTVSARWSFLPKARVLFTPKLSKRVLGVTGTIAPKHTGATTVRMMAQQIVRGKVKATKTATIRIAAGRTAFSGQLALLKGTWHVKISHADATHASSVSAVKTVIVR